MGLICDSENVCVKVENEEDGNSCQATWSEENDCLPLKQRLKLLLASKSFSWNDGSLLEEQSASGHSEADKFTSPNHISHLENTNVNKSSTPAIVAQPDGAVVKIGQMDDPVSLVGAYIDGLSRTKEKAVDEIKTLIEDDILDDLDHVVLVSRQRMLFQKQSKLPSKVQESSSGLGCRVLDTRTQQIPEIGEDKSQFENEAQMSVQNHLKESHKTKSAASANGTDDISSLTAHIAKPQHCYQDKGANKVTNAVQSGEDKKRRFVPKVLSKNKPCGDKYVSSRGNMLNSLVTTSVNVKAEPLEGLAASATGTDDRSSVTAQIPKPQRCYQDKGANMVTNAVQSGEDKKRLFVPKVLSKNKPCGDKYASSHGNMLNSLVTSSVNVKAEPLEGLELEQIGAEYLRGFPFSGMIQVKSELETLDSSCRDELDHMLLSERMKLLSRESPQLDTYGNLDFSNKVVSSSLASQPTQSESANPQKVSRPKKRRKTATDSVETALEEDAPGLFQALLEKGVAVDEMKLYGQTDNEEGLDESSLEESFSDLEAVISQLFSHRSSLLKLPPVRCNKGEKVSYCLACLFSLVEQARYLRFRNWPVEWGWCRDLQSFIFVFERHNRIVLERPEYGYATYFFELVNTLPINWQLKRLVTAMKLASCSRVALIEDRALMIGEDMNEGEARVLMEYGWIPNSGLGTMLNYCDRVVHDRRNEKDSSEWRSKIGKLLIDGYNGGEMVPSCIPVKVEEYNEIDAHRSS